MCVGDADGGAAEGVWLTRRTGRLMGDFVNHFHSRPIHYGGPNDGSLMMLHPYPQVPGSKLLAEDGGVYVGGDFAAAQDWVEEGQGSSLRFRFFLNRIIWKQGELVREVGIGLAPEQRAWIPTRCSANLVLSEVDSIEEKPLWVQIAELAGGEAESAGREHGLL